jgi:hypothetical protein
MLPARVDTVLLDTSTRRMRPLLESAAYKLLRALSKTTDRMLENPEIPSANVLTLVLAYSDVEPDHATTAHSIR